ncbi:putative phospholipase [Cryptosporidium felis]|nr:putative phospholipase [Cryptosporidium felis]
MGFKDSIKMVASNENTISIDFSFRDFDEQNECMNTDGCSNEHIIKPGDAENTLSSIASRENAYLITGCKEFLLPEKKTPICRKHKGNYTTKNVFLRELNSSELNNEDCFLSPRYLNGNVSNDEKKIRFNALYAEDRLIDDELSQRATTSGTSNKTQKEDFNSQKTNEELKGEDLHIEQSSPCIERKLPIIEGYGPFSPRKSKQPPHIMLIVHGIGSNESAINKNKEEFVHQLESVKAHWFWEVDIDITVDAVDWKSKLASVQDHMFNRITLPQHRENRMLLNKTIGDVMYFMVPRYGDYIISEVAKQLNQKIKQYKSKISEDPKIVLIGHSLGSVIVYELVSRQQTRITKSEIPKLEFDVDHLFLWGSPLPAMLVMIFPEYLRSGLTLPKGLAPIQPTESFDSGNFFLNKCPELKIYNVFHPYDPVAFRLEPLLYPNIVSLPEPVLLPYWRNLSKRTYHQWDKEMENARKALYDSISGITSSISNVVLGGILGWTAVNEYKSTLEVNLVSKDQKIKQTRDESVISKFKTKISAGSKIRGFSEGRTSNSIEGEANQNSSAEIKDNEPPQLSLLRTNSVPGIPIRVDYQLQEGTTEHYISSLAFLQSHFNYWKSRDLGFFILWKIIEDFEPVISHDDYKSALENLKQDQSGLERADLSSEISGDSSYSDFERD